MSKYYTVPVEIKVGNSRVTEEGNEILIARIHNWNTYLDLEIIDRKTGVQGYLRVNKPTETTSS